MKFFFDENFLRAAEGGLRVDEPALGFRNGASESARGVDPFLDNNLEILDDFAVGFSVGHAPQQFRDFGDEGFVFITPIDDDFVPNQGKDLQACISR